MRMHFFLRGGLQTVERCSDVVYSHHKADNWIKTALHEEGKFFLGHVDGLITTGICPTVNGNALSLWRGVQTVLIEDARVFIELSQSLMSYFT